MMSLENHLGAALVCLSGVVVLLLLYIAHLKTVHSKRIASYEATMQAIRERTRRDLESKRRFKPVRSAHLVQARMVTANTLQARPAVDGSDTPMRFLPPRTSRTPSAYRRSNCCNADVRTSGSRDY